MEDWGTYEQHLTESVVYRSINGGTYCEVLEHVELE